MITNRPYIYMNDRRGVRGWNSRKQLITSFKRVMLILCCLLIDPIISLAIPTVEDVVQRAKEPADIQLLVLSELMGYIEPCGCTVDLKLGAIERLDALVRHQKSLSSSIFLTVGSHLHDHLHLKDHSLAQERAKATLVRSVLKSLKVDTHLAGTFDQAAGEVFYQKLKDQLPLTEITGGTNSSASVHNYSILKREEGRIGVIGLSGQVAKSDQSSVISQALIAVQSQTPDLLVVISTASRASIRSLALQFPQVSLWVLGRGALEEESLSPVEHNDPSQRSYIVEAGDRGRHLGVVSIYGLKQAGPLVDIVGDRQRELKSLKLRIKMKEKFAAMSQSTFAQAGIQSLKDQWQQLSVAPLLQVPKRIEYQLIISKVT